MRRSIRMFVCGTLLTAWGFGCAAPSDESAASRSASGNTGWTPVGVDDMSERQRDQRDQAITARNEMLGRLMATLKGQLSAHGPAAAISVCRDEAPKIAREIAEEHGLRIGRTSHRLRNPANTPPEWARPLVADRVTEERYATGHGVELAALFPIRLQSACLSCHGPTDTIPDSVSTALAANYPEDRATGFREGELRGWFWVEVPGR